MPSLLNLDLRQNGLRDPPENLNSSSSSRLERLYLGRNLLSGRILEPISKLVKLTSLDLSFLNMIYPINIVFSPLKSLEYLDLSGNSLSRHNTSSDHALPKLTELTLSNCNIFEFPKFIMTLQSLEYLDLSWNNLLRLNTSSGQALPTLMNLRHNNINGKLPDVICRSGSLTTIAVSFNLITGKLPRSLANCTRLKFLDVRCNNITDTFPFWLNALPLLQVVLLSSNRFYGSVSSPQHTLPFSKLQLLDISHNNFNGSLPSNYFVSWSTSLVNNILEDYRQGENRRDQFRFHHSLSSRYEGRDMRFGNFLMYLIGFDFSGNRFEGQIPESIGLLKWLIFLNLSNNGFTGHIPSSMGNLSNLESLDISRNQLSGTIPQELAKLFCLGYLNMSYNKLTGQIPQGTHLNTFDRLSYEGNTNLCGSPLNKSCQEKNGATSPQTQQLKPPKQGHVLNSKAATIGYGPTLMMFGLGIGHAVALDRTTWFIKLLGF